MWLFSLIRNSKRSDLRQGCYAPKAPRKHSAFRPRLEVLEDRWMPSILTVTNNLDTDRFTPPIPGSLRYEIGVAQSGDTIVFSQSLKGQTLTLNGEELYIDKSLDIDGLGSKNLA